MAVIKKDLKLFSQATLKGNSISNQSASQQMDTLIKISKEGQQAIKLVLPNNNINLIKSVLKKNESIQELINAVLLKTYFERSGKSFAIWRKIPLGI